MNLKKVHDLIKKSKRILICTHINPDLDAVCSELAMAEYLRALKKKVFIVHEAPVPSMYRFLPGVGQIKGAAPRHINYDLAIILDCGELSRIGKAQKLLLSGKPIVNIDHHFTSDYFGDVNVVCPKTSSTAEIIFEMFTSWKVRFTKKIAQYLYLGILTDTGSFRYQNTMPRTHEIAAELLKFKFSPAYFYRLAYEDIDLTQFKILLGVIAKAKYFYDGKVVYVSLTKEILAKTAQRFDLKEKLFYALRMMKPLEAIIIFSAIGPAKTRVNFRATGSVNVAAIAQRYGGGGHRAASGCMLGMNINAAEKKVLPEILKKIRL